MLNLKMLRARLMSGVSRYPAVAWLLGLPAAVKILVALVVFLIASAVMFCRFFPESAVTRKLIALVCDRRVHFALALVALAVVVFGAALLTM